MVKDYSKLAFMSETGLNPAGSSHLGPVTHDDWAQKVKASWHEYKWKMSQAWAGEQPGIRPSVKNKKILEWLAAHASESHII